MAITIEKKDFYISPYVCVHPDYQGHGISQKIINYIIEHLSTDIQEILLEVRKDNNNALQAYHKMGFYETEDRDEKYLMKKEIHKS
ncbi:GNAT family N-acetyltransferase [Bacteroides faecis]|nr:GNAT family N-acetyltransferase [Bacteroides faecis]UVQ60827.1 GNAT family N-acetyltransferase [Bacteroides faecis]